MPLRFERSERLVRTTRGFKSCWGCHIISSYALALRRHRKANWTHAGSTPVEEANLSNHEELRVYPISRCKGPDFTIWEFVEEKFGTWTEVMEYAGKLQGPADAEWQYRIWDCRE